MTIALQRVHYMPKELKPGILYVSEEFGIAAHLCPCGCGSKIRTPLGPTEWSVEATNSGPSLRPSVGNWQQACQSHYWIDRAKSDGPISGRPRKSPRVDVTRKSADTPTMMPLIVSAAGSCDGSGVG